jgi:hypothetical protein
MYSFFLQPSQANSDNFWNTVVDPVWLANSPDANAAALRTAQSNSSIPWRILYRVTDSERFLPPLSPTSVVTPSITPVMAIPVLNPVSDFLFTKNPSNDIAANVVLVGPTTSGLSAGTVPTTGPSAGMTIYPNNVIPFDIASNFTSLPNWGDSANSQILKQLLRSILAKSTIQMSTQVRNGSTKVTDVIDPVSGSTIYSVYIDPNGITYNASGTSSGLTIYQDVNGNPIQYYDGKNYHSTQADYIYCKSGRNHGLLHPAASDL